MKDTIKLLKLYMNVNQPRIMIIIKIISFVLFTAPITLLTEREFERTSIILLSLLLHIFSVSFNIYGIACKQFKFYMSMKSAKTYYTIIPVISVLITSIPFDIYHFAITANFVGIEFAMVIAMFNAIFTICACAYEAFISLPKVNLIGMLIILCFFPFWIYLTLNNGEMLNLPVNINFAVILGIYIVGIIAIVCTLKLWWKKSGRTYKYINFSTNTIIQN